MKIYFVTGSERKAQELEDFLASDPTALQSGTELVVFSSELGEVLDCDIERIVREKAIDAYQRVALPCVVEHSGLFMDALPGLPGGLGQVMWRLVGERMCDFLREADTRAATARSVIGYCDGRRVTLHTGETRGRIAEKARGDYAFNWDQIFIPEGSDQTYGEMGMARKRGTSPIHKAWRTFLGELAADDRHVVARF
jgi:XTP/dITP diphosphohydrolase